MNDTDADRPKSQSATPPPARMGRVARVMPRVSPRSAHDWRPEAPESGPTGAKPTDREVGGDAGTSDRQRALRDFLAHHAPFDELEPDALAFLIARLDIRDYPAGTCLTTPTTGPADRFHIIQIGRVHGETPSEDERIDGDAWALIEGECFPIGALISRRAVRTIHRAVVDTRCLELDRADFDELRRRSAVFADFCARRIASLLERLHGGSAFQRDDPSGDGASADDRLASRRPATVAPAPRQGLESFAGATGDDAFDEGPSDHSGDHSGHLSIDHPGVSRLDAPLAALIRRAPVTCSPDTALRDALERMRREDVGSIVVTLNARPEGLFTLRDLLRLSAQSGFEPDAPMRAVMTRPVVTLPQTARGLDALERFVEHGIKHAVVVDEDGAIRGVLSERELLRQGPSTLDRVVARLRRAGSLEDLRTALAARTGIARALLDHGAPADEILRVLSHLHEHATRRVIGLVAQRHDFGGLDWQWLSFGSAARLEQALITDQDNGIVFDDANCDDNERDTRRARLLAFAGEVNDALAAIGFVHCPGGIMAGQPDCCLGASEWARRFARWIDQGTPEHLLRASIFFDWRVTHVAASEAAAQRLDAVPAAFREPARANSRFRRQLTAAALDNRPPPSWPLTWLGRLQNDSTGLDIKRRGLTPLVDAARILSLEAGGEATATLARLSESAAQGGLRSDEERDYAAAVRFFQRLRLEAQLRAAERGEMARTAAANSLDPEALDALAQRLLKESFRLVRRLQQTLTVRYQL